MVPKSNWRFDFERKQTRKTTDHLVCSKIGRFSCDIKLSPPLPPPVVCIIPELPGGVFLVSRRDQAPLSCLHKNLGGANYQFLWRRKLQAAWRRPGVGGANYQTPEELQSTGVIFKHFLVLDHDTFAVYYCYCKRLVIRESRRSISE
jgi:hypothetical protein